MDIRLLKYFLAVTREENITCAAEKLYISHTEDSDGEEARRTENRIGF